MDPSDVTHEQEQPAMGGASQSVEPNTTATWYESRERHGMYEAKSESLHKLYRPCPLPRPGLTPHQQTV